MGDLIWTLIWFSIGFMGGYGLCLLISVSALTKFTESLNKQHERLIQVICEWQKKI